MNKTTFLVVAVIILAILNIIIISLLWKRHPKPSSFMRDPKSIIISRLGLDENQVATYENLIAKHRSQINEKELELSKARQSIYLLLNKTDLTIKDSLLNRICEMQMEVEQIHFNHFEDIKNLCHTDQIASFQILTEDLADLFNKPKRKPK
jgi:hypothetical protein